jgi:MFS family permease
MSREDDSYSATETERVGSSAPPVERSTYRANQGVEIRGGRRRAGINIPATLAGTLAAIGSLVLLAGLIAAALGAIGYQTGLSGNKDELSIGGLISGLVALFVAFVIGGWVAARIARYRGPLHGLITALWMLVLAAILAALGAWAGAEFNVFSNVGLPQWFSKDALTTGAIISGLAAIAAMLLGGWLGGRWGEHSGNRGDVELVETREAVTSHSGGILGRRRESQS